MLAQSRCCRSTSRRIASALALVMRLIGSSRGLTDERCDVELPQPSEPGGIVVHVVVTPFSRTMSATPGAGTVGRHRGKGSTSGASGPHVARAIEHLVTPSASWRRAVCRHAVALAPAQVERVWENPIRHSGGERTSRVNPNGSKRVRRPSASWRSPAAGCAAGMHDGRCILRATARSGHPRSRITGVRRDGGVQGARRAMRNRTRRRPIDGGCRERHARR